MSTGIGGPALNIPSAQSDALGALAALPEGATPAKQSDGTVSSGSLANLPNSSARFALESLASDMTIAAGGVATQAVYLPDASITRSMDLETSLAIGQDAPAYLLADAAEGTQVRQNISAAGAVTATRFSRIWLSRLATMRETGSVATAANAVSVSVSGSIAVVCCRSANLVQVYDISADAPVKISEVSVTSPAYACVVGTSAWVITATTIRKYTIGTSSITAAGDAVSLGADTNAVMVLPCGSSAVMVLCKGTAKLQKYSTAVTPVLLGEAETSAAPYAFDTDGSIAIVVIDATPNGKAEKFNVAPDAPAKLGELVTTGLQHLKGVALYYGSTRAMVVSYSDNRSFLLNVTGDNPVALAVSSAVGTNPYSLCADHGGTVVYEASGAGNTVESYDGSGTQPVQLVSISTGESSAPVCVAISNGIVCAVTTTDGKLHKFDARTAHDARMKVWPGGGGYLYDLTLRAPTGEELERASGTIPGWVSKLELKSSSPAGLLAGGRIRATGVLDSYWPKIHCMGDSITAGTGSTNGIGYRSSLFSSLLAAGISARSIGSQVSTGTPTHLMHHDGYPGCVPAPCPSEAYTPRLSELVPGIYAAMRDRPDVLVLLCGINMLGNYGADLTVAKLAILHAAIRTAGVTCPIIQLSLTPVRSDFTTPSDATVILCNTALRAACTEWGDVTYLDVHTPMLVHGDAWLADTAHPNDAGYAALGGYVSTAIQALISANRIARS